MFCDGFGIKCGFGGCSSVDSKKMWIRWIRWNWMFCDGFGGFGCYAVDSDTRWMFCGGFGKKCGFGGFGCSAVDSGKSVMISKEDSAMGDEMKIRQV